jgi:hypothetical protein
MVTTRSSSKVNKSGVSVHVQKKRLVQYSDSEESSQGSDYTDQGESEQEEMEEILTQDDSSEDDSSEDDDSGNRNQKFKHDIYRMFNDSMAMEDWTSSDFHKYLVQEYIYEILSFHQKQNQSADEWVDYITYITRTCGLQDEIDLCIVKNIKPYVGTCDFRNQTRTISCCMSLDGDLYYSGKRCANALKGIVDFYLFVKHHGVGGIGNKSFTDDLMVKLDNILSELF